MQIKLYIAQSLDGYIAGPNGELDWLEELPNPKEEDFGYTDFYDSIDLLLMGQNTYAAICSFGIDWPYQGKQTFVFSRAEKLSSAQPDCRHLNTLDAPTIASLRQLSKKSIWLVGGGALIREFLRLGAIDEMIISIIPRLLGEGTPLFLATYPAMDWQLEKTETFANGIVNLHYTKV